MNNIHIDVLISVWESYSHYNCLLNKYTELKEKFFMVFKHSSGEYSRFNNLRINTFKKMYYNE